MSLLYSILAFLDGIVYWFIASAFSVIIDISQRELFNDDLIDLIINRIYIVIGVLMLFKIVLSAIQYLVNPDSFDDKEKGLFGVLQRSLITVSLIVLAPTVFKYGLTIQSSIVESIPSIILGEKTVDSDHIGRQLSFTVLSSFINAREGTYGCVAKGNVTCPNGGITDIDSFVAHAKDGMTFTSINGAWYDYMIVVSTVCGVFMCYILVSMALEVVIRMVKFELIRILSPIPISSYIFNKDKLNKFIKLTLQVYADLFIQMAVAYFVIFVIKSIVESKDSIIGLSSAVGGGFSEWTKVVLTNITIILGILIFAKKAPKFLTDLLGLPEGTGSIGDMFKRAGGFFGSTLGGFKTAHSNFVTQKERAAGKGFKRGRQIAEGLKSAAAGFGSAARRGMLMPGQGKGFNDVRKNSFGNAIKARDNRIDRNDNLYTPNVPRYIDDPNNPGHKMKNPEYYGWWQYRKDKSRSNLGIPSTPGYQKAVYDAMESIEKAAGAEKNFGATKMNETPNDILVRAKDGRDYTIATARAYANIQVGTKDVIKPDGTRGEWTAADFAKASAIKETVEKQTAYLKTALMLAKNDPSAKQNRDETIVAIQNNRTMFNRDNDFPVALSTYISDATKGGKRFCSSDKWNTRLSDIKGIDDILRYIKEGPADDSRAEIEGYAELIKLYKTVFEDTSQRKNIAAHAAEARAKKTQQAIQNEKK